MAAVCGASGSAWLFGLAWLAGSPIAAALDAEQRVAAGEAFRAAERGEWQRAFAVMAEVADPLAAKTLSWLYMMEERKPADFATLAGFLLANPDWPWPEQLQIIAEGTITDPADHELIRRLFQDRAPLTTRGSIRYAEALLKVDQDERAQALLRRAWIEGDFSSGEELKFYRKYRRLLTTQDHIDRLDNLLWDYRRSSAMRMLDRVPEGYRKLAMARMRLQRRQHGVDAAIKAVPASLGNDPGLLFDRMRWRRQKRLHDGVVELLLDPPDQLVHPPRWWFERELQISRALRSRDFDLAYRLASRHGQSEGEEFAAAEWLAGWLALRFIHQPNTALRHFTRLYEHAEAPVDAGSGCLLARPQRGGARQSGAGGGMVPARRRPPHRLLWPARGPGARQRLSPGASPPLADAGQRVRFEDQELVRVARMLIEVGATSGARPVPDPARRSRRQPRRGRAGRPISRRRAGAPTWSPRSAASRPTTATSTKPPRSRCRTFPA